MKISIMSDLHLEFAPLSGLPGGDVLILAGDIWLVRDMRPEKNDAGSRSRRKRYVKFCREELSKASSLSSPVTMKLMVICMRMCTSCCEHFSQIMRHTL
jgi:hypothetical protein